MLTPASASPSPVSPLVTATDSRRAFTLVELLIVIAIIGVLAGIALGGVFAVSEENSVALTKSRISSLVTALEQFRQDEGRYPGESDRVSDDDNQFPALFNAIFGEGRPLGPGGRSAPNLQLKHDQSVVWDSDTSEYRRARRSEIRDASVDKFLVDAWEQPLVYRCNRGQKSESFMQNPSAFDLYSTGPDEVDQTKDGGDEENDDLGNW